MQKLKISKREMTPIYDSRASFYGKAKIIDIYNEDNSEKVGALLLSYNSLVAGVTYGVDCDFYLNERIRADLLYSQTTLRHIKEFYKQEYKRVDELTKADLQKKAIIKPFDYLKIEERGKEEASRSIADQKQLDLTISPDTTQFFKNTFENYREKQNKNREGVEVLTSSKYGVANYYFYNIKTICEGV